MVREVAKVVVNHLPSSFYVIITYSCVCKVNGSFGIDYRPPFLLIYITVSNCGIVCCLYLSILIV